MHLRAVNGRISAGLLLCLALLPLVAAAGPATAPATLSYVESSAGLIPPSMEAGHTELEMADVNGDGNPDLVSIGDHGSPHINTDQHGLMVWLGDGNGGWSVRMTGEFGYGGVALGDVNGDGLVDAAYGMHHNYSGVDLGDQILEVALGDGTGTAWTPWDNGLATNGEDWGMFGTDLADVDGDGDLDVGSISFGCCAGVHVYLNQGDGSWQQSFGFLGGNSGNILSFGDVNGDGSPDLAVSHSSGFVYLGDGAGGFTLGDGNLPPPDDYAQTGVALGDVTDDGRADLSYVADGGGLKVWTWTGPGTWQDLSAGLPASGPYEATQLVDMNMDGHGDLAAFGNGQVRVWAGDGGSSWTEVAAFTVPGSGYFQAFRAGGDADHNGFPDLALVDNEGNWPNDQNHTRFYRESSAASALEVKPVFPHGGEVFRAGSTIFVDWLGAVPGGGAATVSLEFSAHGPAGPWQPLAADVPNGGRYQWRIPPGTPASDDCYLRFTLSAGSDVAVALTPGPFEVIGGIEEPIAGLAAANDSPTALGAATSLTATVASGTHVDYTWAFGDGASGSGPLVSHVYPGLGSYTAVVTAANLINVITATTAVTITDAPISSLAATNDSPTLLGEVTALTATVEAGSNVTYLWSFGDGATGSGAAAAHVYPMPGPYTATVTATNPINVMTATTSVTITAPRWWVYLPLVLRWNQP